MSRTAALLLIMAMAGPAFADGNHDGGNNPAKQADR